MFLSNSLPYDFGIVSPNGALDSYYRVNNFCLEGVNRANLVFHTAGGKGHNLARAAVRLGGNVLSMGIIGGDSGRFIEKDLKKEGIGHDLIWADMETRRCNTIFIKGHQDTTVILEAGPKVGEAAREELVTRILERCSDVPIMILTGSLPPDFPSDFYAMITKKASSLPVKICIDSSGEPLRLASLAGVYLIKVNRNEFQDAFGVAKKYFNLDSVRAVYNDLRQSGLQILIVTDGANGAYVFAPAQTPFRVITKIETWESTAGAGDTFMAGFLLALTRGETVMEAACYASAAAAANLQQLGCGFFDESDVPRFLKTTSIQWWE